MDRSVGEVEVVRATHLADFLRFVERTHFDLIVVNLLVPRFKDSADVNDVTENILEACRDPGCRNKGTQVVALTAFDDASDNNYKALNAADVTVLTFDTEGRWKTAFDKKCLGSQPENEPINLVIICALSKEVDGFAHAARAILLGNSFLAGNLVLPRASDRRLQRPYRHRCKNGLGKLRYHCNTGPRTLLAEVDLHEWHLRGYRR